ncbi:MAG: hypothetical protein AAF933_08080, partial [Pseudomonadota bacterium]
MVIRVSMRFHLGAAESKECGPSLQEILEHRYSAGILAIKRSLGKALKHRADISAVTDNRAALHAGARKPAAARNNDFAAQGARGIDELRRHRR